MRLVFLGLVQGKGPGRSSSRHLAWPVARREATGPSSMELPKDLTCQTVITRMAIKRDDQYSCCAVSTKDINQASREPCRACWGTEADRFKSSPSKKSSSVQMAGRVRSTQQTVESSGLPRRNETQGRRRIDIHLLQGNNLSTNLLTKVANQGNGGDGSAFGIHSQKLEEDCEEIARSADSAACSTESLWGAPAFFRIQLRTCLR